MTLHGNGLVLPIYVLIWCPVSDTFVEGASDFASNAIAVVRYQPGGHADVLYCTDLCTICRD